MFELDKSPKSHLAWKLLPAGGVIVAVVIALLAYLGGPSYSPPVELEGVLRQDDPTFKWYSNYLRLERPKASLATTFAGNRAVLCSGVIHNEGEKTLDVVEIRITLFNYDEPIWEAVKTPIRPGNFAKSLAPLKTYRFDLYLEDLPDEWKSSHAELEINGVRFEKRAKR